VSSADAPDLARRVGERLRARRGELGWTLADTARAADVSVSYLSSIEKGNNLPSLPILVRVSRALDVSLNELLRDVGAGQEPTRGRLALDRPGRTTLSGRDLQLAVVSVVAAAGDAGPCPVPLGRADVFVYVLEGTLDVTVDGEEHRLRAGDSLDAESPLEVAYASAAGEPSAAIWAAAPSAAGRAGVDA
jgi:transcriptional regulator with XRE-family HTH domain